MSEKTRIALVSITVNAVGPISDYISRNCPDVKATNYLDGALMEKVRAEGINAESMGRMLHMISNACKDGNEAIIITCTVFTKYREYFEQLFGIPVLAADTAMLTEAASQEGKKAIIYSFPGTYNATLGGYQAAARSIGKPEDVDMILAEGAYDAAQAGNLPESDRLIREKIMELDEKYDTIALAQISMAGAAQGISLKHAKVFTSPSCAVAAAKKALGK